MPPSGPNAPSFVLVLRLWPWETRLDPLDRQEEVEEKEEERANCEPL